MQSEALIFIPDISGFTQFMTRCKLAHSRQILFNLMDIILDSNQVGLKISEIEGDAVLFYIEGDCPEPATMVRQAKRIFTEFHAGLQSMEDNVFCGCGCGACTTASKLTLKFIVHFGVCSEVPYNGSMKLIGKDVILAHRLLKNTIPHREYILFSEQYLGRMRTEAMLKEEWVVCHPHREEIEDFGEVASRYIPLYPLKEILKGQPIALR